MKLLLLVVLTVVLCFWKFSFSVSGCGCFILEHFHFLKWVFDCIWLVVPFSLVPTGLEILLIFFCCSLLIVFPFLVMGFCVCPF